MTAFVAHLQSKLQNPPNNLSDQKEAEALSWILGRYGQLLKVVGPTKNCSLHASADSDKLKPQSRLFYDFLVGWLPHLSGREPSGKPFSSGGWGQGHPHPRSHPLKAFA